MFKSIIRLFAYKEIKIEDNTHKRLDVFLIESGKGLNWGKIHSLIKKKSVFVKTNDNKQTNCPSHILTANDRVLIREEDFARYFLEGQIMIGQKVYRSIPDLQFVEEMLKSILVYKNEDFLVINKPVGMFSQGTPILKLNVSSILNTYYSSYKIPKQSFVVHRLDKPVSGLMLLATNRKFASQFSAIMKNREVEKHYECFVKGIPSCYMQEKKTDTTLIDLVGFNDSKQKAYIGNKDDAECTRAVCEVQILNCYKIGEEGNKMELATDIESVSKVKQMVQNGEQFISHLRFKLITGKRHQIRLFAEKCLNAPILFDFKYGYRMDGDTCIEARIHAILSSDEFMHSDLSKVQKFMGEVYKNREYIYLQSRSLAFQISNDENITRNDFKVEYNSHFQLLIKALEIKQLID